VLHRPQRGGRPRRHAAYTRNLLAAVPRLRAVVHDSAENGAAGLRTHAGWSDCSSTRIPASAIPEPTSTNGLALRSPEIELEAITIIAGNVSVERGVECALERLDVAGATHVPVHHASRPELNREGGGFAR
jgi:hypothetical protein